MENQENPEEIVEVEVIEEAEIIDVYEKWYGVPPKGEQPLPPKYDYVLLIFLVMAIEIGIWGVYRYTTAPIFEQFGTLEFYLFHIVFAPTIHLIPIILFWRFFRKERGLPFVFTKKLLMSAVIVGFCGAIIWRFLEELVSDSLIGAAGATVPGTFTFYNLFSSSTILLFSIMTFVQFFIVGPVEELEFRGFAYDQSSRVLPNWQAVLFSSVLFGCSHIPIALFVYQFPPHEFVAALFGWISAGVVFAALYMWSRNIFACIVMHGMGNWQLSVFYFKSTEIAGAMSESAYVMTSIGTSIIVDGIVILIFFLIHRYYWQPHRRGEPAFGGAFLKLQNFIHEHDFFKKPVQTTIVFLVVFVVVSCGIIMGLTYALGETDMSKRFQTTEATEGTDVGFLESMIESKEYKNDSSSLNEENSETIAKLSSEDDKYIKQVKATITWTDESDETPLQNQPDTFTLTISGPNGSDEKNGDNPPGGQGSLTAELSYSLKDLSEIISTEEEGYIVEVVVSLDEAGDQVGPIAGRISEPDSSNDYQYTIEITWLVPKE